VSGAGDHTPGLNETGTEYWLGVLPSRILGMISCILLFVMMMLTFVDVAGRYLFLSPLPAAYEMIAFTMPGIIFCALPMVNYRERHVTIDLLDTIIPKSWARWQGMLVNLFAAGAMSFISWRLAVRSYDHFRFNEVTDELYLKLWIFSAMMAVLTAVAAVVFLVNSVGYASGRRQRPDESGALTA
jgi:TRAP-type C4-dicarboxylate transport system permease small subunit